MVCQLCTTAARHVHASYDTGLFVRQGVLTPFDRLDGYERKIQSGPAEAGQSADMNEPSAGTCCRHMHCVSYLLELYIHLLLLQQNAQGACGELIRANWRSVVVQPVLHVACISCVPAQA